MTSCNGSMTTGCTSSHGGPGASRRIAALATTAASFPSCSSSSRSWKPRFSFSGITTAGSVGTIRACCLVVRGASGCATGAAASLGLASTTFVSGNVCDTLIVGAGSTRAEGHANHAAIAITPIAAVTLTHRHEYHRIAGVGSAATRARIRTTNSGDGSTANADSISRSSRVSLRAVSFNASVCR